MARKPLKDKNEITAEIRTKEEALEVHNTKKREIVDFMEHFREREGNTLTPQERQDIEKARDELVHLRKLIQDDTLILQEAKSELDQIFEKEKKHTEKHVESSKPQRKSVCTTLPAVNASNLLDLGENASAKSETHSDRRTVKSIDAKVKKALYELKVQYTEAKLQIETELEEIEANMRNMTPNSHTPKVQQYHQRLLRKYKRLERDYQIKKELIIEGGNVAQKILVDESDTPSFVCSLEIESRTRNWIETHPRRQQSGDAEQRQERERPLSPTHDQQASRRRERQLSPRHDRDTAQQRGRERQLSPRHDRDTAQQRGRERQLSPRHYRDAVQRTERQLSPRHDRDTAQRGGRARQLSPRRGRHENQRRERSPQDGQWNRDDAMLQVLEAQLRLMSLSNATGADKVLPKFDGNPENWGIFKASFDESQNKYRFDDFTNWKRLQAALVGPAFEAVRHLLYQKENVQEVLDTLEMQFGRPQCVIRHLKESVLKMKKPEMSKPETIVKFGTAVEAVVVNCASYRMPQYLNDYALIEALEEKLPDVLKQQWYDYRVLQDLNSVDLREFNQWLKEKVAAALLQVKTPMFSKGRDTDKPEEKTTFRGKGRIGRMYTMEGESDVTVPKTCNVCKKAGHLIDQCWSLKKKSVNERWDLAKEVKVCFLCLKSGHSTRTCKEKACGVNGCTRRHHELLHPEPSRKAVKAPNESSHRYSTPKEDSREKEEKVATIGMSQSIVKGTDGPLPIVPVRLRSDKFTRNTYALLDSGATRTLISAQLAEKLNLSGPKSDYKFKTLSGDVVVNKNAMEVQVEISGHFRNAKMFPLDRVMTVEKVAISPYSLDIEAVKEQWPHLQRYKGRSLRQAKPEIVIGGDHGYLLAHRELLIAGQNEPVGMKTVLGWVIQGKFGDSGMIGSGFHVGGVPMDATLNSLILESFKLSDFGLKDGESPAMSKQDQNALEIMKKTTSKRNDGRWETGLLWKTEEAFPEATYDEALARLAKTEARMRKNPEFAKLYFDKMSEYNSKGYIRKLTREEAEQRTGRTCYIPHFGVFNPNKPGKFRLVFDCATNSTGKSFNDYFLTGPDLLKPLPTILWNFRRHKYVITGDIEDMFHRVYIREEDRMAQRFLWRDGESSCKADEYEMVVMIFGATSSPSSAIYVKDTNAKTFAEKYPDAVDAILNSMYMDDCLTGGETVCKVKALCQQITEINQAGGFSIKKWMSNSPDVMKCIPKDLQLEKAAKLLQKNIGESERVLGLYWQPAEDIFTFRINFHKVKNEVLDGRQPTKREMCSVIMSLFDPLGFVNNFKIKGMILFQSVWKSGVEWDDPIPSDIHSDWLVWINRLKELENIQIPRNYEISNGCEIQLHTFVDSSAEAMACVLYYRIKYSNGNVKIVFVASKANVAPLKKLTIPRLELCAALIGSKLAKKITEQVKVPLERRYFWCDSATVLSWINSEAIRYKEYVANRISKIQSLTDPSEWRWIPTAENVADEGTRVKAKAELRSESRWLRGPDFLRNSEELWPTANANEGESTISTAVGEVKAFVRKTSESIPEISRFSAYHRLVRATGAVIAAGKHWLGKVRKVTTTAPWTKNGQEKVESLLSPSVLILAEKSLLRHAQRDPKLMEWCSKQRKVQIKLDADGLVRVVGRVTPTADIGDMCAPILLPPGNPIVDLICDAEHIKNGHTGRNTVYNNLRQRYWLPDGRQAVRRSWTRCMICRLSKAKPIVPEMGMLPFYRVASHDPPFTYTGADLFGPIEVTVGRHHEKRWGLLLTCMVTRGIHLEILNGLSMDECMMGLSRFVDSRGVPRHLYSDNGTNFQAAAKEIQKCQRVMTIEWHFIPPAAPHMGGAWESMVKQVKRVLYPLLSQKYPRDQVLLTAFKAVENIVNSRPLSFVSSDLADEEALTPNHFLRGVGIACNSTDNEHAKWGSEHLSYEVAGDKERWGKMWEKAQVLAQKFWSRWTKEVLPNLLKRNKWNSPTEPISVGEVVFMVDENSPRNAWKKAIVTKTFPGKDGIVRVVEVTTRSFKTKTPFTYKRAVAKICPTGLRCDMPTE